MHGPAMIAWERNRGKVPAAGMFCVFVCICVRVINSSKIKASHIKHILNAMSVKYALWYEWALWLSFRADIFSPRLYLICKPLKMSSKAQETYS